MKKNEIKELNQKQNLLGKISALFITRFRVVYLIIIALLVAGYLIYAGMPREAMPEVSTNMIQVSVIYQGVSANDMESLVTDPLESNLEGLDELDSITSTTKTGSTSIILGFDDGTDMGDAMTEVKDKVSDVNLPEDAADPFFIEYKTSEMPIMQLTVNGNVDMTELKHYGEVLQARMEAVPGISNVEISGGYTREIQILVNQSDLTRYGISIGAITNAITSSDVSMPLSSMALEGENYNLRIDESYGSIEDIERVVVRADSNSYVMLKDIATVSDGYATPTEYSYYYMNKGVEEELSEAAIYLQVYREDNYDMVAPAIAIHELIDTERDDFLPEAINVIITGDESADVSDELTTVIDSAISGFIVVIIVLFLFIGLNEAFIVASVIPMSLLISVILLDLNGMTFNTLTLTGFIIALGLLVDNAIVILENVDRLRDMGIDRVKASRVGANQVAPAVFAASLTTIVAFLPLLVMEGTIGAMIRSLPMTIVFSIIASFVVSLIITPALTSRFLSKFKHGEKKNQSATVQIVTTIASALFVAILTLYAFRDFGGLSYLFALMIGGLMFAKKWLSFKNIERVPMANKYKEILRKIMDNKKYTVGVVLFSIGAFILSISTLATGLVGLELFPVEDPDSISISLTAPEGYLLDDTREIVYEVENKLYGYEDIESFNATIGGGGSGGMMFDGSSDSNKASIEVDLKDDRTLTGIELLELIREDMTDIPGANILVDASLTQGPSSEDISVSFKGDNAADLEKVGQTYYEQLIQTEGIVNPEYSSNSGAKELVIKIDDMKATRLGYTVASISQEIRNQISGINTVTYTENEDEINVTVYVNQDQITSIKDFEKLYFTSNRGETFGFLDVASIEVVEAVSSIQHEDGQKVVTLTADVDPNYNLSEVVSEFNASTEGITIPYGVEEASGGGFGDMTDTLTSMVLGLLAAIMLVYIILSIQFNSLHQPLVILFSVPLAVTGVMAGLLITGNNLGFYAMMGMIALVGIAVNDAIVLLDYMNYLRKEGMDKKEAILEGVRTRFIPVFTTSITTIGGVLPLAVFNPTYGQLGIALIFGLVASTLLTLLVIPVIYSGMDTLVNKIKSVTGILIDHEEDNNEALALTETLEVE